MKLAAARPRPIQASSSSTLRGLPGQSTFQNDIFKATSYAAQSVGRLPSFGTFTMAHSDPSAVEQQRLAYESLCCYLDKHENEVLEIEILPPAITPPDGLLLEDGSSLGVPKKVLVVAFLEARRAFFDNKDNSQTDPKVYHIIIRQPMCSDMLVYENFINLADPPPPGPPSDQDYIAV